MLLDKNSISIFNAGTDTGSDLILLQKHTGKKALSADEEFFIQSIVDRDTKVPNNKYFTASPQNVICTEAKVGTDQFGKPVINYKNDGGVEGIPHDLCNDLSISTMMRGFETIAPDLNGILMRKLHIFLSRILGYIIQNYYWCDKIALV